MIRLFLNIANRCVALLCIALLAIGTLTAQDELNGKFSSRTEIQKRLASAQQERSSAAGSQQEALQKLEATCQYHLAALDLVAAAKEQLVKTQQALQTWQRFPNNPPYSIRFVDDLRERRALAEAYRKAPEAQIRILNSQIEAARDQLNAHQSTESTLEDQISSSQEPETLKRLQEDLVLEQIGSRTAAEDIGRLSLRLEIHRAEQEIIQLRIQFADIQLKAVDGKFLFTQNELDEILNGIREQKKCAAR